MSVSLRCSWCGELHEPGVTCASAPIGKTVTSVEFDASPRAVYDYATHTGPVTVLDSKGRPSLTVVVPRIPPTPLDLAATALLAVWDLDPGGNILRSSQALVQAVCELREAMK